MGYVLSTKEKNVGNSAPLGLDPVTADAVLDRVKHTIGATKNTELADLFGVSKTTISAWKRRNTIPYDGLLRLHFEGRIDFVYCLLGISIADYMMAKLDLERLREEDDKKERESFRHALEMFAARLRERDY